MATPLKEGYYFGSASLNKKSLGLQRRSGHGWAKDRGGAGIGFSRRCHLYRAKICGIRREDIDVHQEGFSKIKRQNFYIKK